MKSITSAKIISVGTELLLGEVVNTDTAYLARLLASFGIPLYRQSVVGDNRERLLAEIDAAFRDCDTVFLTGGLGPTCDDITRETVAEYFALPLSLSLEVLSHIESFFTKRGAVMGENNRRQAMVPQGAEVFMNSRGTAPGLAVHGTAYGKSCTAILIPGPPAEFCAMCDEHIAPYLESVSGRVFVSKNVRIYGMGEAAVEECLRDLMDTMTNPTVAPYCEPGEVRVRVTAAGESREECLQRCDEAVALIRERQVGRFIYDVTEDTAQGQGVAVAVALVREMKEKGLTLGFTESCTGGLCAKLVTDVAGASSVLRGGFVTYATDTKVSLAGVPAHIIDTYGVVSEECAAEMASGAAERLCVDLCVSVTGLAGPGGDSERGLPAGHVCFGVCVQGRTRAFSVEFGEGRPRDTVRTLAAMRALHTALEAVREI